MIIKNLMENYRNTLVTVCITTYNRENLLPKTVKSVLNQTYNNLQVIIVDDHSKDGTEKLVKNILLKHDNRIQYLKHDQNLGLAAARNSGIRNAKGKYFTFVDDDDRWEPNFVEEFVTIAKRLDSQWCFVCGNKYKGRGNRIRIKYPAYEGKLKNIILQGFTPPVASQFYFTKSLIKIGGYNEKVTSGIDHDLWLRLAEKGISVKSISSALSVPNDKFDLQKMTGQRNIRTERIKNSLLIWQNQVEKTFGKGFFKHFCKQYNIYLQYCSCYKEIISKKYFRAFLMFIDARYKHEILTKIGRTLINQFTNRKLDIFQDGPLFKPYLYHEKFK